MVYVNPRIAEVVAFQPGMKLACQRTRDRLEDVAKGLFASHDNPGGHEITEQNDRVDALVSLEGPAPLSVEFGHWTPDHKRYVEGLHILGRAVAQVEAEGRL